MTKEEIIQELEDKDIEIADLLKRIEQEYQDLKLALDERKYWEKKLLDLDEF